MSARLDHEGRLVCDGPDSASVVRDAAAFLRQQYRWAAREGRHCPEPPPHRPWAPPPAAGALPTAPRCACFRCEALFVARRLAALPDGDRQRALMMDLSDYLPDPPVGLP